MELSKKRDNSVFADFNNLLISYELRSLAEIISIIPWQQMQL